MNAGLDGQIVVITGAARGIGAAIAARAAASGAEGLVLVDRDPVTADPACSAEVLTTDLALPEAPDAVIEAALSRFGRIDGLVNCAGLTTRASFTEGATVELWNRLFSVNARAPFFLMAGAIADARARKAPGTIVNIQSVNAHCGAPDLAIYAATKGALQTLTKNAANAHMADRIRANGINLGWVATESERHLHAVTLEKGPDWLTEQGRRQPLGRFVTEDECARLAVFLLSPASAPLTGACIDLEQKVTGAP
jgi:NAD(P)-dependent dehydrogenase (short-subunit alcohol dehydrogenase family)